MFYTRSKLAAHRPVLFGSHSFGLLKMSKSGDSDLALPHEGKSGIFEFYFAIVIQLPIFLHWTLPFLLPVWPLQAFEVLTFNVCSLGHIVEKHCPYKLDWWQTVLSEG